MRTSSSVATHGVRPVPAGVDVIDAIYDRRAVRDFEPGALEPSLVRLLIEAAVQAPSAVNHQPWAFVVVQDPALLARIAARAKETTLASLQPGTPMWAARERFADPAYDVLYRAGTLIVIVASPGEWHVTEDCCLAAENLMLAAHGLGLGTCPIGLARAALDEPEFRRELSIPPDHRIVMPIVVGRPRGRPEPPPRRPPRILAWK